MGARDLLANLAAIGVTVQVHGANLIVRPWSLVPEGFRQALKTAKPALLDMLAGRPVRPYQLTLAESDDAHADPWDAGAIARFQARARSLRMLGHGEQDADDLAERLHLRDVHADYRHLCLECQHFRRPGRCRNFVAAGLRSPELALGWPTTFQDCGGFADSEDMR